MNTCETRSATKGHDKSGQTQTVAYSTPRSPSSMALLWQDTGKFIIAGLSTSCNNVLHCIIILYNHTWRWAITWTPYSTFILHFLCASVLNLHHTVACENDRCTATRKDRRLYSDLGKLWLILGTANCRPHIVDLGKVDCVTWASVWLSLLLSG